MTFWFITLFCIYIIALVYCAFYGRKKTSKKRLDFLTGGSSLGAVLGFFTFSATLFSTFTLMGIPDFFRNHGVGAWIFLGVTDVAMAFLTLWFGIKLRKRIANEGFESVSSLLCQTFGNRIAGTTYLVGVFIFLVPYVSIQIRGVAIFLEAVAPIKLPMWVWALSILLLMLVYSGIGGLKAIMYSDVIQGTVLLVVTWIIAIGCVKYFGGIGQMFDAVKQTDSALLSTPGPKGLFTPQFLIASFLAILVMPITQPQLTIRIAIMRNTSQLKKMAAAVSVFAFLVILPTIAIGCYGAVKHSGASTAVFLANTLVNEQVPFIAAAAIVGLLAAAMSTADSQLFALGTEFESFMFFSVASFILALLTNDQLVMLARVSFAGTSLLAPMILAVVLRPKRLGKEIPIFTLISLTVFLLSVIKVIPSKIGPVRMDLFLLCAVAFITVLSSYIHNGMIKKEGNI
jgi:SSS family solute:Na+ symporter